MNLEQIKAAESKLLITTYDRYPLHFVSGEGAYLIDEKGERYLDLLSGIGVNALGYSHPAIEQAIAEQSKKLVHLSNLFYHDGQARLAEKLTAASGMDRAFFSNSGTEAWEAALKLSRAYAGEQRKAGKPLGTRFLALEQSFHGRTMGSVATTYTAKYREPFAPVMPEVEFVRFNDIADLKAKFSNEVCAVLLEAIQGEGGVRPVSPVFMQAARELTRSTGALLVVDEIQAGLGRTGKWFAYQHYGVQPDITTLAKPLAGGLPLGAMLATERVAEAFHPGMHGTTFGGGPLACAVALAVIETIEREQLLDHVTELGSYFREKLEALAQKHSSVVEVRGLGLMLALELATPELATQAHKAMLSRRIILNRTQEKVLRLLPPYVLQKPEVDLAVQALDEIFTELTVESAQAQAGGQRG